MLYLSWPCGWLFAASALSIGPWCHHGLSTKAKGRNYLQNCEFWRRYQEGAAVPTVGCDQGSIRMPFHGLDFSFHAPGLWFLRRSPQRSFEPIYNLNDNCVQLGSTFKKQKINPCDCPLGHMKRTRNHKHGDCRSQYREFVFAPQRCSPWAKRRYTFIDG
jgi:hypothetical protein